LPSFQNQKSTHPVLLDKQVWQNSVSKPLQKIESIAMVFTDKQHFKTLIYKLNFLG